MDKDELTIEQFAKYRLERAKQDLSDAEFSYKNRKISQAKAIREDSDYDDEYEPKAEETQNQIETARELIELVEKYLENKNKNTM